MDSSMLRIPYGEMGIDPIDIQMGRRLHRRKIPSVFQSENSSLLRSFSRIPYHRLFSFFLSSCTPVYPPSLPPCSRHSRRGSLFYFSFFLLFPFLFLICPFFLPPLFLSFTRL